jgi:hypothetical protein
MAADIGQEASDGGNWNSRALFPRLDTSRGHTQKISEHLLIHAKRFTSGLHIGRIHWGRTGDANGPNREPFGERFVVGKGRGQLI